MSRAVTVRRRRPAAAAARTGAEERRRDDDERTRSAYVTYYETLFSSGTGDAWAAAEDDDDGDSDCHDDSDDSDGHDDSDEPMMAAVFPRCDKTARARAAVSRSALQLYLLAEVVVASGGRCACDRTADDHDPICACAQRAAVAFQAATAEFCGGGGGRRTDREVAYDDQDPSCKYARVIARHAMSKSRCRCGDAARCLHRCLLHTVFLEKVVELYGRAIRRGPRDAATQTRRDGDDDDDDDDDDGVTKRSFADRDEGPVVAAAAAAAVAAPTPALPVVTLAPTAAVATPAHTVAAPAPAAYVATPTPASTLATTTKSTVSAACKRVGKPSRAKYIQVRYKEKRKPAEKNPTASLAVVAASPEAVPPSEPLEHARLAAGRGGPPATKAESSAGRGWNPFRWLRRKKRNPPFEKA